MFYAHKREDGSYQTVAEHLEGTAKLSADFASAFGEEEMGRLVGLAHDIGKCSDGFQKRLEGDIKVDHSSAGALECAKLNQMFAACCVMGHHGGLPDFGNRRVDNIGTPTFCGRLKKAIEGSIPKYTWDGLLPSIEQHYSNDNLYNSMWIRMLYSCLVDADYLDTEAFVLQRSREEHTSLKDLSKRLDEYIKPWFPPKTELNTLRCEILEQCREAAASERGIYTLTVPTGGGKTISSMAFALKHAVQNDMQRVIYVIPYTSIIEQNAKVFRDIFGEENVVEHHSSVTEDGESDSVLKRRLATENWDAPIIVTTAVQFFESLYSNKPSKCRKLHNIANSVIVFDEAQMIPASRLRPSVAAIAMLAEKFRSTVVLCTATQPVLDDLIGEYSQLTVTEICPDTEPTYEAFRRVTYKDGGKLSNDELCQELSTQEQVLCIVNTQKTAQEVYEMLPKKGSYHLSTLMHPKHRRATIDEIRQRLKQGLCCRVVSTSLIEAGVDVDFPRVYREINGLDSIVQAAGRCNREGKRLANESIVTYFTGEGKPPILQEINIAAAKEALKKGAPSDPETVRRYFSSWRALKGDALDKSKTVTSLREGISGCLMPFKTVAERFRYIDDTSKTIYIISENEALWQRLSDRSADRKDYREAGQYAVNIYENVYNALLSSGDIRAIDEDSAILINTALYDEKLGFRAKVESGKAYFE